MPNNLTDAEENRLLDLSLVDGDKLALMSALGSDAAAGTEVTGGSYTRQTIDWAAAASGAKSTAASISFTGMPTVEVLGWSVWDSTGATRRWYGVFAQVIASATASTDTLTATAHGKADGDKVVFQTGYAPTGLSAGTVYFVRDSTANTFKVAATAGGAALDITGDTATVVVGKVLSVTSGGSVNIASGQVTCSLS
jgi:hypothetical protein